MSKLNQIQNALRELSGASFQKLAEAYLYKKGYEHISPLGSVIGADKVRSGTPDTFITLPNGKYVFAEYTTQREKLYEKLKNDLKKCFNETITGVPIEKIQEVVFCHTSILLPKEENALAEECQKHGVNLNIFGIGSISHDLYQKYPGLARDFLGIKVDTGQIVAPDEFVVTYNKNKLVTRLDTTFHFREKEVNQVLQGLEDRNLVIVSGRAGVGKTRFALECCNRFKKAHPEYEVKCVFNRGPDLFEDLRVHFSEPNHYLILVDDANRISRFDYVVQLLQDKRENQQIKVIATVRDYALHEIRDVARSYQDEIEVEITPLDEKQIKQLIEDEYDIHNYLYLDRIADIAQGNPRLAFMAAEIAKRENTLQSISNVSALYDEYFTSIRKDLEELDNEDMLKVAGIVAFFRAVDHSNSELMGAIQHAFGISSDVFWEAACRLHELEIFDIYEDEVVRISDQVLATYLFYLVFFKKRLLDFSAILNNFFPSLRHRLVDSINPILNAFGETTIEAIRPHVDRIWESMENADNEGNLLHLMDVFWFLKKTETLIYIRNQIGKMELKPIKLSDLEFKANSNIPSPSLLSILGSFRYADNNTFKIALELLLDYLEKQPEQLPQVLYLLTNQFGFDHTSYLRGFFVQRAVIDALWSRVRNGEDKLFSKLFLAVAKQYLNTHFDTCESKGAHTLEIIKFDLPPTPELLQLRKMIWNRLFQLHQVRSLREEVLRVLRSYSTNWHIVSVGEIVAQDAEVILPFIESKFDTDNYRHCSVVQDYLDFLEHHKVDFCKEFRKRFRNETYALAELLLFDWKDVGKLKLDYNEFQRYKQKQIKEYFNQYTFADYKQFFDQCLKIQVELDQKNKKFQFQNGIVDVLLVLSDRDSELYTQVLKYYLEIGDPLSLTPDKLTEKLVNVCGTERAYEILSLTKYPTKRSWLFSYYHFLPPEKITAERLNELLALYQEALPSELPHNFDFLLKYRSLDEQIVVRVVNIILEKMESDPNYSYNLIVLFDSRTNVNKIITELFYSDLDTLKRAYLAALAIEQYVDYDGDTFTRILDLNPDFILEYIDQMYKRKEWLSSHDDIRNYSFLWKRDDYEQIMTQVVERIYKWEKRKPFLGNTYLGTFFTLEKNDKDNSKIMERQYLFLRDLIKNRQNDSDFMKFIFNVITLFSPKNRREFIALFLKYNKNFEDFQQLSLEPIFQSWSGSAVPMLQGQLEYFESLLPLLNSVEFLQHKQHIEQRIQGIRSEIEKEKKRDFITGE